MGVSSSIFPSATSCRTTTAVKVLVLLPIRNLAVGGYL